MWFIGSPSIHEHDLFVHTSDDKKMINQSIHQLINQSFIQIEPRWEMQLLQ
jgi:hypothetical protein